MSNTPVCWKCRRHIRGRAVLWELPTTKRVVVHERCWFGLSGKSLTLEGKGGKMVGRRAK